MKRLLNADIQNSRNKILKLSSIGRRAKPRGGGPFTHAVGFRLRGFMLEGYKEDYDMDAPAKSIMDKSVSIHSYIASPPSRTVYLALNAGYPTRPTDGNGRPLSLYFVPYHTQIYLKLIMKYASVHVCARVC